MAAPPSAPERAAAVRRAHDVAERAERLLRDAAAEDPALLEDVDAARDELRGLLVPPADEAADRGDGRPAGAPAPHAGVAPASPPAEVAAACEALVRLGDARGRLRDHALQQRFRTLERIHDALGRLGALQTVAELLPAAAAELAAACGFERAVISRRRGATWRAEAVWTAPGLDPEVSAATERYLRETWIPIGPKALEADLVRRRTADLVAAGDPRTTQELMDVSRSAGYVAAPVMPTGRVIGFLQADRADRGVGEADRDNLWTFAEGFGLVFERVTLLERLEAQRERARSALQAAERGLAGLSATGRALRREAPVRAPARAGEHPALAAVDVLTAREREVLELMATGAHYREIATRLTVGETTVKSHVHAIFRKLGATSRADAVSRHLRGTVAGGG